MASSSIADARSSRGSPQGNGGARDERSLALAPIINRGDGRVSVRCYVRVAKDIRFGFQFFKPILNDISDADDAYKISFINDRQMPQAMISHEAHGSSQRVIGRDGNGVEGHNLRHRHRKRPLSVLRNGVNDVSFRY
jgi:hypothetical protein